MRCLAACPWKGTLHFSLKCIFCEHVIIRNFYDVLYFILFFTEQGTCNVTVEPVGWVADKCFGVRSGIPYYCQCWLLATAKMLSFLARTRPACPTTISDLLHDIYAHLLRIWWRTRKNGAENPREKKRAKSSVKLYRFLKSKGMLAPGMTAAWNLLLCAVIFSLLISITRAAEISKEIVGVPHA